MPPKPESFPNSREGVILSTLLHGEVYGREVRNKYEERTGEAMPLGSLYVTLERMEQKGFLTSRDGESTHERGGNRRRYFKITGAGVDALNRLRTGMGGAVKGWVANG